MKRTPTSLLSSPWVLSIALALCTPEYVQAQWSARGCGPHDFPSA